MKNIKRFSELKHTTYKSASDKLKEYGLNKRASKLDDYSKEVKHREELDEYFSNINSCKKYGTFEIELSGVKYDVVPKFGEKYYDDDGYDFKISCNLYGDISLFNVVNTQIPFFDIICDDYGVYDIEFVTNNTITNRIKIDRRNAIKLKRIIIANFKDNKVDLVSSIEKLPINDFYRENMLEELKPTTYVSAADKLRSKHPKRARNLVDHAEDIELKINKKNHKLLLDSMDNNRFNISIETYKYSYNNGKYNYTRSLEIYKNCALSIHFSANDNCYNLEEAESDIQHNDMSRATVEFYLLFVPESYEDYIKIQDTECLYLYFYYNISKGSLNLDNLELNNFQFIDRPSSGRFLQIIKNIFDKKITYKNGYSKDVAYEIEYDFLAKSGVSSEYGLCMDDFIKVIDKTSANKIYKEV